MEFCSNQYAPQIDQAGTIQPQCVYRCATARSPADNVCAIVAPSEMLAPTLAARTEKRDAFLCFWIGGMGLGVLVRVASQTGPGEILQNRRSASRTWQNVVKSETLGGELLGRLAILAQSLGAFGNHAADRG